MLIRTRQEHDVETAQAFIAGNSISGNGAVSVADMELVRGVVDWCGAVECRF